MSINAFAINGLMPDVTFFLDLTPEEGLKRIASRSRESDRLDKEKLAFHQKVYEGYKIIIKDDPKRFVIIDARKTPEEETKEIVDKIMEIIK